MKLLHPRVTVLSGATIGLIAGAAVYGAVASSATATATKPAKATVAAVVPASAARCAAGQELEKGVCIVNVVRTVVVPAPSAPLAVSGVSDANQSGGPSTSDELATAAGDSEADDATEEAKDAEDATDDSESDGSGQDEGAGEAPGDDDVTEAPRG